MTLCLWQAAGCTTVDGGQRFTWSGACVFTPDGLDCSQTQVGQMIQEQPAVGCTVWNPPMPAVPACDLGAANIFTGLLAAGSTISEDETEVVWTGTGACFNQFTSWWSVSGSLTIRREDEDTRAAAIARLLAASAWSEWGSGCTAQSLSETYLEGEWRIQQTNLEPLQTYSVDVTFWRATAPGGPFTLFSTETHIGVADGSGNLNFSGSIPNQEGYYTEARCDCIFTKLS